MKKFFYLLASAALLLGACTKDEDPSLKVSPESLAFDGSASSKNVTIESNTAWEITGIKDWVSINKTSGNGNETIIVTVLENDGLDRECTVNISSSAAPATIKISQTGRPNLNVSEKDLEFGSEAGEKEVTVKTNKDWTVQNNCDWITVTPSSGKASDSEQTVKIAVAANTESERTGELTFAIDAETSVKVSVRQEGSVLEYAGVKYRTVKMKDAAPGWPRICAMCRKERLLLQILLMATVSGIRLEMMGNLPPTQPLLLKRVISMTTLPSLKPRSQRTTTRHSKARKAFARMDGTSLQERSSWLFAVTPTKPMENQERSSTRTRHTLMKVTTVPKSQPWMRTASDGLSLESSTKPLQRQPENTLRQ